MREKKMMDKKEILGVLDRLAKIYTVEIPPLHQHLIDEIMFQILVYKGVPFKEAESIIEKLKKEYVDLNEVRVSFAYHICEECDIDKKYAPAIKELIRALNNIYTTLGDFGDNIFEERDEVEIRKYLSQFLSKDDDIPTLIMLNKLGFNLLPISNNTLIFFKRMGLVPRKCTKRQLQRFLTDIGPSEKIRKYYYLLEKHTKEVCKPDNYDCENCKIKNVCKRINIK